MDLLRKDEITPPINNISTQCSTMTMMLSILDVISSNLTITLVASTRILLAKFSH